MSDDEESDEPAVELGEGEPVEGAPPARVASRLTWPITKSDLLEKEGDAVVRTPDGPREVAGLLDDVETTYFDRRQTFLEEVAAVTGDGPVPTADE
jgi:hypothetical protein